MVVAEYLPESKRIGQVNTMRNGMIGTIENERNSAYTVRLENGTALVLSYKSFLQGNLKVPLHEVIDNKDFWYRDDLDHERVTCCNGEVVYISSRNHCSYDIEYPDGCRKVGVSKYFLETYIRTMELLHYQRSKRVRDFINCNRDWHLADDRTKWRATGNFKDCSHIEIEFEDGVRIYTNLMKRTCIKHPLTHNFYKYGIKIVGMELNDNHKYICTYSRRDVLHIASLDLMHEKVLGGVM